ncbi:MAG: response regulator, partial [Bacteroidota bacterium]
LADQIHHEYGHRTVEARHGKDAVEILQSGRSFFDLILLDYDMPVMNGLEVVQWLKDQKNDTPVVMLTGAGTDVVAVEAMKLGVYDYMRKEQLDLTHLGVVLRATQERHLFRIAKVIEEERAKEIGLNKEATEKVRNVINALTPAINSALANIDAELGIKGKELMAACHDPELKKKLLQFLEEVRKQTGILETGIGGLLSLYQIVYARFDMSRMIDAIKIEYEQKLSKPSSGSSGKS